MIVKCASCQTRFKIGDDKVTEKGVKVRCTKCGTIFTVRKGDAPAALEPGKAAPTIPPYKPAPMAVTPLSDLLGADLEVKPVPPGTKPPLANAPTAILPPPISK